MLERQEMHFKVEERGLAQQMKRPFVWITDEADPLVLEHKLRPAQGIIHRAMLLNFEDGRRRNPFPVDELVGKL